MARVKMSEEENRQWNELYSYVKDEILHYEKEKQLPRNLILRLKGLKEGKFMANSNTKGNANYEYKTILTTFKINKFDITNAIRDKDKFKNEKHMINYIMVIVESKLNDTLDIIKTKIKSEEMVKKIEINNVDEEVKYIRKTDKVTNNRLNDLW